MGERNVSMLTRELADRAGWYLHIRAMNSTGLLAADTVHFGPLKMDARRRSHEPVRRPVLWRPLESILARYRCGIWRRKL